MYNFSKTKPIISGRNTTHAPRAIVVVNNSILRFKEFTVEQSAFSAADSFEIVLPFFIREEQSGDPVLANGVGFQSALLTQDVIPVQVYVGYSKNITNYTINDLVQIMDGTIDTAAWDFDDGGEFVTINGRNVVGKLIDAKIIDKFPNQTASAIATNLANKYGLTPVIWSTSTLAGSYYNDESAITPDGETTEWDLLQFLAKEENFIVRVKGKQLLFGPYSEVSGYETSDPIIYTWGYDISRLRIERSPQMARDIEVKVISYDRNSKTRIVEIAKSTTKGAKGSFRQLGRAQKYIETYTIPGLTREQAQKKALAIYNELSRSQLIGNLEGAGNIDMAVDRCLQLNGVGLGISNKYYLNRVSHKFSFDDGYGIDCSFSSQFMPNDEGVDS